MAAAAGSLGAEVVAVRHPEGLVHGFLALRTLTGETIADGDLIQTSKDGRVTSRLVFRFRDGSVHDETAVFTQDGTLPAGPRPVDPAGPLVRGAGRRLARRRDG